MEIGIWRNSGRNTIRLGHYCEGIEYCVNSRGKKVSLWKVLWMKMKREKRKILENPTTTTCGKFPYDAYSYSQNFDQGNACDEPDNLSRSFSARFALADASRIFFDKQS